MSKPAHLSTKIFLDSGDPEETKKALTLLGFLDGETTNPSLVMKNPHIQELKKAGELNVATIWKDYNEVAEEIRRVIPEGSISVEVYADNETSADTMLVQARKLASWFEGIFVKVPATNIGLEVAEKLVAEGINVNVTLCFSQEQAAAVHMATVGAKPGKVYVSPFIGRLDDTGQHGLDLIKNIVKLYEAWGSHVSVLAASVRNLDHLFGSFESKADIATVPLTVLQQWKGFGLDRDPKEYVSVASTLIPIEFKDLEQKEWNQYDLKHELTDKGIEKFAADWKSLLS